MEPKTLLNADYLDIIFDKRNKTYGGYELRRNYNRRVKKAAGIMAVCFTAILSFSFIAVRHNEIIVKPNTKPITVCDLGLVVPPVVPPPHPSTPPPAATPHANTHIFTPPEIVIDKQIPDDKVMPENAAMNNAQPGLATSTGDVTDIGTNVHGPNTNTGIVDMGNRPNTPVRWVEQMPEFSGNMNEYMSSHLLYPEAATSASISGKVIIEFVVNEDGSVSNVKVLRGIGGGCDEEAARMVSSMPKWKPGKQNGMPVKVLFTLPINFVLN